MLPANASSGTFGRNTILGIWSDFFHLVESIRFPLVTRKGRNSELGDAVVKFLVFQEWSDKWPNFSFFPIILFTWKISLFLSSVLPPPFHSPRYIPSCNILFPRVSPLVFSNPVAFSLIPCSTPIFSEKKTAKCLSSSPSFDLPGLYLLNPQGNGDHVTGVA